MIIPPPPFSLYNTFQTLFSLEGIYFLFLKNIPNIIWDRCKKGRQVFIALIFYGYELQRQCFHKGMFSLARKKILCVINFSLQFINIQGVRKDILCISKPSLKEKNVSKRFQPLMKSHQTDLLFFFSMQVRVFVASYFIDISFKIEICQFLFLKKHSFV